MNKNRPYKAIAILHAIAALGFFVSGILGKNSAHLVLGACFVSISSMGFVIAKNKDDETQ